MLFVPSVGDDILRYYRGTYIKLREYGDKLFYIQHVNSREIAGTTQDGGEFKLFLSEEFPYEVEYVLPKKSYFQHTGFACLLQRVPAKQYQRGLSDANTHIRGLDSFGGKLGIDVGFPSLLSYVGKQAFPSFLEALTNKDGNVSTVLSPRFALTSGTKEIYLDEVKVASVSSKEKTVMLLQSIFRPEIEALVQTSGFKVI